MLQLEFGEEFSPGESGVKIFHLGEIRRILMSRHECPCGYVYDPAEGDPGHGIEAGTAFEDLPDDWVCPQCGAEKEHFWEC